MKLVKMSLLAATLITSSAFAIDNVKVSGDAELYYGTTDMENAKDVGFFHRDTSYGQAGLDLGLTADLAEGVSGGVALQGLSTLGLENQLVSGIWAGNSLQTQYWFSEAYVAMTLGKTTAKVGRQTLDTPLAFTETWNIASNTFDAAVLLNQDIPDTTLVAAWVGRGNGASGSVVVSPTVTLGGGEEVQTDSFSTFAVSGAYALAAVNNSWKPLTAQLWYYNVRQAADAAWVQADLAMDMGIIAGVQYASIMPKGVLEGADDSSAIAAKIGYTNADLGLTVSLAGSQTDTKGQIDISNVATGHTTASQSKLYTEAWWNYGYVGAADMTAINVTAEYAIKDVADLGLYVTNVTAGDELVAGGGGASRHSDMMEVALTAGTSFGPLDTTVAYIYTDAEDQNPDAAGDGQSYSTLQAYLTLNF